MVNAALALKIGVLVGALALVAACGSETPPAETPASPPSSPSPDVSAAPPSTAGSGVIIGHAPEAAEGTPSIIVLRPHVPVDVPLPTEPVEMDQFGRAFIPRLLLIRQGQTVLFKNSEDDLHTVHVHDEQGNSLFNVAMPIRGGRHEHTFTELGEYAISCEAHPEMAATIFVIDTPYYAVANRDGAFSLEGVPAGSYDLLLRRGEQRTEQVVQIEAGENTLTLTLPSSGA